jgi:hypothetical protein
MVIIPAGPPPDACHEQLSGEGTTLTPNDEPPESVGTVCDVAPVLVLVRENAHCVNGGGLTCRFTVRVTPPNDAEITS